MGKFKHGFNLRADKSGIKRRFYNRWQNMKTRCSNSSRKDWKNYGGRGIKVCDRWSDFRKFLIDMYPSFIKHIEKYGPEDTTLERIDVNSDYSLSNCIWATKKEQMLTMRKNIKVMYLGSEYTVQELVKVFKRSKNTIYWRLYRGIPLDAPYRKSRKA